MQERAVLKTPSSDSSPQNSVEMIVPQQTSVISQVCYSYLILRVIALPSIKYNGRVEADAFESQLGRGKMGREPACRENNN